MYAAHSNSDRSKQADDTITGDVSDTILLQQVYGTFRLLNQFHKEWCVYQISVICWWLVDLLIGLCVGFTEASEKQVKYFHFTHLINVRKCNWGKYWTSIYQRLEIPWQMCMYTWLIEGFFRLFFLFLFAFVCLMLETEAVAELRLFPANVLPAWQIMQICAILQKLILRFVITISTGVEFDLSVRQEMRCMHVQSMWRITSHT